MEEERKPFIRHGYKPKVAEPEQKERISPVMGFMLISVAAFIDIIQALLSAVAIGVALAPIISVGATALFWIWYKMLDVDFVANPKRFATFSTQTLAETIPIPLLSALPMWTVGTIITVVLTRSEDKGGALGSLANIASPMSKVGKK